MEEGRLLRKVEDAVDHGLALQAKEKRSSLVLLVVRRLNWRTSFGHHEVAREPASSVQLLHLT